jgi:hypothetical protein
MAHHEHGTLVVDESSFNKFQRSGIQVIGRFVEHNHIGGLGKQLGQQDPVSFSTGEEADLCSRSFRREQKILQLTKDMF